MSKLKTKRKYGLFNKNNKYSRYSFKFLHGFYGVINGMNTISIKIKLIIANLKNPLEVFISNGRTLFAISGDKINEPASKHKIKQRI